MSSTGYVRRAIAAQSSKYSARSSLASIAREKLSILRAERSRRCTEQLPLVEYVHHVSPELEPPKHLEPYAKRLEIACPSQTSRGELREVVAAPPQHGKTELTLRAYLWWDNHCRGRRHAYVTYNSDRALSVARTFWLLAQVCGYEPRGTLAEVRLKGGSTVKFTSIGGRLTGDPVDGVCVIDDPIKGPDEARSPTIRKRTVDWFDTVAWTRRHPGTSFVVMATRWHLEDLSGVLIGRGWRYTNLKAIAEGEVDAEGRVIDDPLRRLPGEALWPSRKSVEFFEEDRAKPQHWAALYQGEPRPVGGEIFREPGYYTRLPESGYTRAYGVDLAYTSGKTLRDFSALLELWRVNGSDPDKPTFYVVNVDRKQVDAPSFAMTLKARLAQHRAPMLWRHGGTEKGVVDFMKRLGIGLRAKPATQNKVANALPVSAAWNLGRVLVPDTALCEACQALGTCPDHKWVAPFIHEVQSFTGEGDEHDDQVDALAYAFEALKSNDDLTVGGARSNRR